MQRNPSLTGTTPEANQNCATKSRLSAVRLTKTEVDVLGYIRQGCSSQEAADRRIVSKRTIDFHLANIYTKLQVNNRVQALRKAQNLGLLPDTHPHDGYLN